MIYIKKSRIPEEFYKYAKSPGANYEQISSPRSAYHYAVRFSLTQSLLIEQGYICAYCMQRIGSGKGQMRVEHYRPKSEYPYQQLNYYNLLASCYGSEMLGKKKHHCDVSKNARKICINPLDAFQMSNIDYKPDGTILYPVNAILQNDIDKILNLNQKELKEKRKKIYINFKSVTEKRILEMVDRKRMSSKQVCQYLRELLVKLEQKDKKQHFVEYVGILRWYLKRQILALENQK